MSSIKSIELKNFRAFNGTCTIDLTEKNRDHAAKFVLLYAPNGTGKTSVFDAVEWTLNGEIHRLKHMKNNKFEGKVLCNHEANSNDFHVKFFLDDNNWIKRAKGNGTVKDYTPGLFTSSINKEAYSGYKHWNSILLSHDKIDGFISASKPSDRYNEWVSFLDEGGESVALFDFILEMRKKAEKDIDIVKTNINKLIQNIKAVELSDDDVRFVNEAIIKARDYGYELDLISGNDDFQGMNELLRQVVYEQSIIGEKKEVYQKRMRELLSLLEVNEKEMKKRSFCRKKKITLEEMKKDLTKYSMQIEIKKRVSEETNRLSVLSQELSSIQSISIKGAETFKEVLIYIINLKELESLKKELVEVRKNYQNESDLVEKCEGVIRNVNKDKSELTDKVKAFASIVEEVNELSKAIESKNLVISQRRETMEKNELRLNELELELEEVCELVATFEEENRIELLVNRKLVYLELELVKIKDDFSHLLRLQEKEKGLLDRITKLNEISEENSIAVSKIRSIIKSANLKDCPVCHTKFMSVDELLEQADVSNDVNMDLEQRLLEKNDLSKEIDTLKGELEIQFNQVASLINTKKSDLEGEKKGLVNSSKKNNHNLTTAEEEIEKIRLRKKEKIMKLINAKVLSSDEDEVQAILVDRWQIRRISEFKDLISKNEKKLMSLLENEKRLKETIVTKESRITEIDNKVRMFNQNSDYRILYSAFNNLQTDIDSWPQLIKYESTIKKSVEEKEKSIKSLNKEIDEIFNAKYPSKDYLEKLIDNLEKEIIKTDKEIESYTLRLLTAELEENVSNNKILEASEKIKDLLTKANNQLEIFIGIREVLQILEKSKLIDKEVKELKSQELELKKHENALDRIVQDIEYLSEKFSEKISKALNDEVSNDIFEKIEPHKLYKNIEIIPKVDGPKPELHLNVKKVDGTCITPEWYFSSAQLNVLALSIFISRALAVSDAPIKAIFIDDPIGHFDDINIIAFIDVIRAIIENNNVQLIMSTHDETIYNLAQMKLSDEYYPTRFHELTEIMDSSMALNI